MAQTLQPVDTEHGEQLSVIARFPRKHETESLESARARTRKMGIEPASFFQFLRVRREDWWKMAALVACLILVGSAVLRAH
jgi:hypothetical protein